VIIFGVRSPLVVDLEETLLRLGIEIDAAVNVNGVPRLADRSRLVELAQFEPQADTRFVVSAFAPQRRRELTAMALELGLAKADAIIDPTAIVPRSLRVGSGTYINAGVVIGGMSFIGEDVFVNRAVSLGHHTILSDLVSIGPGATLAGNVQVGEAAVIGTGAVVYPHVRIGAGAVISAGSVVRKDVPEDTLAAGSPAKIRELPPGRFSLYMEGEE
jgi:sugar O-acyltransferase (sialic acid O-acetyltransferase NeuD family)